MSVKKYSIEIDVESTMTIEQIARKIDRLDVLKTFMIKRRKVESVSSFPKFDRIVAENTMEPQPW